jgi:hypothetical protein
MPKLRLAAMVGAVLAAVLPACGAGGSAASPGTPPGVPSASAPVATASAPATATAPSAPAVLVLQTGHPGYGAQYEAISPDGRLLATTAGSCPHDPCRVQIWDVATGAVLGAVEVPGYDLRWSRDGRFLAAGDDAYDLVTGTLGGSAGGDYEHKTGDAFVVHQGNRIEARRVEEGGGVKVLGAIDQVDGRLPVLGPVAIPRLPALAWAVGDVIAILDLRTGAWRTLSHTGGAFQQLHASPGGHTLLSRRGGQVVLWDPATGNRRGTIQVSERENPWSSFSDDGSVVLLPTSATEVVLYDVAAGKERARIAGMSYGRLSRSGKVAILGEPSTSFAVWGSMTMWDVEGGKALWKRRGFGPAAADPFSPDETRIAAKIVSLPVADAYHAFVYDTVTGKLATKVEGCTTAYVLRVEWRPGAGAELSSISPCGAFRIWNAHGGAVRSMAVAPTVMTQFWWTPDGAEVARNQDWWRYADGTFSPWPSAAGEARMPFELSFTPDGRWLIRSGVGTGQVLETGTRRRVLDLGQGGLSWAIPGALVLSPSYRPSARDPEDTQALVRVRDGARVSLLVAFAAGKLQVVALSPEGKFEALVNGEDIVRVRVGRDLREARLVAEGPAVEALRQPGLLKAVLAP